MKTAKFETRRVIAREGKRPKGADHRRANGGAAPVEPIDVAAICERLGLWWLNGTDRYYRPPRPDADNWISVKAADMMRKLRVEGVGSRKGEGEKSSEGDRVLIWINENRWVDFAGRIAGWRAGFREMCGNRILITHSPKLVDPAPGEWPMIASFIAGLLNCGGIDQAPYFFGWLKVAEESVRTSNHKKGQCLILAGPAGCGKSRLQDIITRVIGGRSANPLPFMHDRTDFNADLAAAEHLKIEEPDTSTDMRSRLGLGERIKAIVANDGQRIHPKNRDAMMLMPFWRLSISLNDEPDRLRVLPPMGDSDIRGKVTMLRAAPNREFWAQFDDSPDPYKEFGARLDAELPAFIEWLRRWEIPAELREQRFGVKSFQHPDLVEQLFELEPTSQFLSILSEVLFGPDSSREAWGWGTSVELQAVLCDHPRFGQTAKALLSWDKTACGVFLARVKKKFPGLVEDRRISNGSGRLWLIHRPSKVSDP